MLIEAGVVKRIGDSLHTPANTELVDGSGKTLLPTLIDAHAHIFAKDALRQALAFGVGTELDMFTTIAFVNQVKKEEADGKDLDLADIRSAGILATAPGGHGTEYGFKIPTLTAPDQAQTWVDARIAEGSDYIKLVYDDATVYGVKVPTATLGKDTLAAVIAAAHKRGKVAVVHIGSLQGAEDAINAGADGLAHLFIGAESEPNFGKLAAEHHIFVVPTLSVLHAMCGNSNGALAQDIRVKTMLTAKDATALSGTFSLPDKSLSCAGAEAAIKQLAAAGVPILAGTDVPNPGTVAGASMHGELEWLVKAGLTPIQALVAGTSAPAKAFHLDDRGVIAPGKRADLLVVGGDPTRAITDTRNIVAVFKQGERENRDAYLAAVKLENQTADRQASAAPPSGSEKGLVSDFESGKPDATYGKWQTSTDSIAGGKSTVKLEVVAPGAVDSKGALRITGDVLPGFAFPWAGAMFTPAAQPANLSSKKTLRFKTRGEAKTYRVMLLTASGGYAPITKTFVAGPDWQEIILPTQSFQGNNWHDVIGLVFAGGPEPGSVNFEIDDVWIE